MQIVVNVPRHYLDAMHQAPEDFAQEAKRAMAAKLSEMRRLSSGMAAQLIGLDRVTFLAHLQRAAILFARVACWESLQSVLQFGGAKIGQDASRGA